MSHRNGLRAGETKEEFDFAKVNQLLFVEAARLADL